MTTTLVGERHSPLADDDVHASDGGRAPGSTWSPSLRRVLGPRPGLLIGFATLVAALVAAFAYVVVSSQSQSRRQAEQRFGGEATLAAQFTSSIFTTSTASSEAAAAKAFGGRVIDKHALDALAGRGGLDYVQIVDSRGTLLAASRGAPAGVAGAASIAQAIAGQASFSDVLTGIRPGGVAVLDWALPFKTAYGRRVEVEGIDPTLIFGFLSSVLAKTRGGVNGEAFVLDSRGHVVGASGATVNPSDLPSEGGLLAALAAKPNGTYAHAGGERYFASAPVQGSSWRVVLSVPTNSLYPALAGSESWLLFVELAAFALAGAASLLLLRRALRGGVALATTNAELAAVNQTLERRVAERTAAVEERSLELARSNAELEQFASVASHDLQEPLRKIRMYCERLPSRLEAELSPEVSSDLERIQGAATRMQRLIDDLLSFARVTSKERELAFVDLAELTSEVIGDLEARVSELGARIEVGELPVVAADRAQMSQLIQNLVSNALKFHRDGVPPLVRIRGEILAAGTPRFNGEAVAGERYALSVEDNGIGFEQKYAERVFSAFERLHGRSEYDGTGIGLSIARKIAWRHRGDITATSVPGQGSTFTLTLPLPAANGTHPVNGSR